MDEFVTLSKQAQLMEPETLIVLGLMQYIWFFLRRDWAYIRPTVIAAGRAGGTTIVIRSRESRAMSLTGTPRNAYQHTVHVLQQSYSENVFGISEMGINMSRRLGPTIRFLEILSLNCKF